MQQSQKYQPFFWKTTAYVIMAIDMLPTGQSCATPIVTTLSKVVSMLSHSSTNFFSKFSQSSAINGLGLVKVLPKLSPSSLKVVPNLFQSCVDVFSKIYFYK